MYLPDKEIANKLGLSYKMFRRLFYGKARYEVIGYARCYDYDEIVKLIKEAV